MKLWAKAKEKKETRMLCYSLLKSRSEIDWACSRMFTVWILANGFFFFFLVGQHMCLSANKLKKSNIPPKNRHTKKPTSTKQRLFIAFYFNVMKYEIYIRTRMIHCCRRQHKSFIHSMNNNIFRISWYYWKENRIIISFYEKITSSNKQLEKQLGNDTYHHGNRIQSKEE